MKIQRKFPGEKKLVYATGSTTVCAWLKISPEEKQWCIL